MKYYMALLLLFFLINNGYGQIQCEQYDQIILEIKESKELKDYVKKNNIKRINFDIPHFLSPFCESAFYFYSIKLSKTETEYCKTDNWLFTDLTIEEAYLKQKSDKKNTLILYFSNVVENQIIIEVRSKKFSPESLLFLYKITENTIVKTETLFKIIN